MLDALESRIREEVNPLSPYQIAREHGLHRWHKGYSLHELLSEIAHLHESVLAELSLFLEQYPATEAGALLRAHQQVSALMHEAVGGSVAQYDEFQKAEAVERAVNLQRALENVNELLRQRGAMLRVASHDLRSSFSVIQGAASLLDMPDNTEQERTEMLQILNRNFRRLAAMLTELMDLARLEAGREALQLKSFDAAALLRNLVEAAQPLAQERGLFLHGDGPDELPVMGDPTKIDRLVQNLLTNALRNTTEGQVSVSWSRENQFRWMLSVQDTGPGLSAGSALWLSDHLRPPIESNAVFDENTPDVSPGNQPVPDVETASLQAAEGEGIGLYIVKRLCELLNASLDVETRAGTGTIIRIRIPVHYTQQ